MIRHVVMFSGGVGSWATAKRVAAQHGTDSLTLLFADTRAEDPDLYRFLEQAAANVGASLVRVADGRTPWQVFTDERFIGNTRVPVCSRALKVIPCRRWLEANTDPATTTVHVGIDWTETHRLPAIKAGYQPWSASAPMCERPYLDKPAMLDLLVAEGIRPPRLYGLGFPHNNCGGACVRGGQAQWATLLRTMPERYAEQERQEEAFRGAHGDVSILRDRAGGATRPLSLRVFRERLERQPSLFDSDEWGGCGCLPITETDA